MSEHIQLNRRFKNLTSEELEPEHLAAYNDGTWGTSQSEGWDELLKYKRILLLAEAGAGKTWEMKEQQKLLSKEGKFSFFIPIEELSKEPLTDILSVDDELKFSKWMSASSADAWFFLDAVDELKLVQGKLSKALRRFAKGVGDHLYRAHIVLSCRPNDWKKDIDRRSFLEILPVVQKLKSKEVSGEKLFVQIITKKFNSASNKTGDDDSEKLKELKTVILLPLGEKQIRQFAKISLPAPADFIQALEDRDAWNFARRPLDLSELVNLWESEGCLGTQAKQHEFNAQTKIKDAPGRADSGVLSYEKARLGAERLALALALTKKRTLRCPDESRTSSDNVALDPEVFLPDWTEAERMVLLRRSLFDPATYGRIRFHHRSVQEYLAACHIKNLIDKGMSIHTVSQFFLAEVYGEKVVIPSMAPIAAWLALWNEPLCGEIIRREPEILLSFGDPEALALSVKSKILRAFASAYGAGSWRGLHIPYDKIKRLAHPDLADVIREIWDKGPENMDVRELLVDLIHQGKIEVCSDLAFQAGCNPDWNDHQRDIAIRALSEFGNEDKLRDIVEQLLNFPENWPDPLLRQLTSVLFPQALTVDELREILLKTSESENSISNFSWHLELISQNLDLESSVAQEFREMLTKLIWDNRNPHSNRHHLQSSYHFLSRALATLCYRKIQFWASARDKKSLLQSCITAYRFANDRYGCREAVTKLQGLFGNNPELREEIFWLELGFTDSISPDDDDWSRAFHAQDGILHHLQDADSVWLLRALSDTADPDRQKVALSGLLRILRRDDEDQTLLKSIRSNIQGDEKLNSVLDDYICPKESDDDWGKDHDKWRLKHERKEAKRVKGWEKWRKNILMNPDEMLAKSNRLNILHGFYNFLGFHRSHDYKHTAWDKALIIKTFNEEIADQVEQLFKDFWRTSEVTLWSEVEPDSRNSTPYLWIFALNGVVAEMLAQKGLRHLTSEDARQATRIATIEMNGLASFVSNLAITHSKEVELVLGDELEAQLLHISSEEYLPLLQDLTHSSLHLKELISPRLVEFLRTWKEPSTVESAGKLIFYIDSILKILRDVKPSDESLSELVDICKTQYGQSSVDGLKNVWLKALLKMAPESGATLLSETLLHANQCSDSKKMIAVFADLFSMHGGIQFHIEDPILNAQALGELVRYAYRFIRIDDDVSHEGAYTPDMRDNAESARSMLLSTLLATPGPEARKVILELAEEPEFKHFPDRLKILARERAAKDSEFESFPPSEVVELEKRYEVPPYDRDSLYQVMMDRLGDLAHDLRDDDFTDRRMLRTIKKEIEMQRTLALRLKDRSKGCYRVVREDEVADLKMPDIRMLSPCNDHKCVIEIKLADKWTVKDLEQALEHQLTGQYLRHKTCKAGCLLLTYNGDKAYWCHPKTNKHMKFKDLLDLLNKKAERLELRLDYSIKICVFGLDLTDPPLTPAHK